MKRRVVLLLLLLVMTQLASLARADEAALRHYYSDWKKKYLKPSVLVPGDYKIAFNPSGTTVSEAMG